MVSHRIYRYLGIVGAVLLPAVAVAELLDLQEFMAGDPISSSAMNSNFLQINQKLDSLQAQPAVAMSASALRLIDGGSCTSNANGGARVTDCSCNAGEVAISGGACTGAICSGTISSIVESGPVAENLSVWRIACENSSGVRVDCANARAVCLAVD